MLEVSSWVDILKVSVNFSERTLIIWSYRVTTGGKYNGKKVGISIH